MVLDKHESALRYGYIPPRIVGELEDDHHEVRYLVMAEDFSIPGVFSQKRKDGTSYDPVGRLSGLGGIVGILAGVYGLLYATGGNTLFQLTGQTPTSDIMMLLLAVGLLLQWLGGKELRIKLGSSFTHIAIVGVVIGIIYYPFLMEAMTWEPFMYETRTLLIAFFTSVLIIVWQMYSVLYTDSTNGWIGVIASLLNGFFFPLLAIGAVYGSTIVFAAYIMLILGQLMTLFYWWSPLDSIREYARSPEIAKFTFGISGFLAFAVGFVAVRANNIAAGTGALWYPLSTNYQWNYPLAYGFVAALLFWVMLGPRLGKKELKAAHISDDLVKGGTKYMSVFLLAVGILAAGQATTMLPDAVDQWALMIVWATSGTMFIIGAVYMSRTDVVTGLPLVLCAIMMSVHPEIIATFVIIPYILVLITQFLLMIESKLRGFTYYSQPVLSAIVTIAFSLVFLMFILGILGSGPMAIWPTNRWFDVALFSPQYTMAIQAPTVFVLPIAALMVRNVSVAGFGKAGGGESKGVIAGITVLFVFLIPMIAAAFKGVSHQALTAASIMLALYAISFILLLSINLSLAGEVEEHGHSLDGMFLRMTAIGSLVLGAVIALIVLGTFTSFPTALQMASVITYLVILITGLEILLTIGWVISGVRLGMFKAGFRFRRVEQKPAATTPTVQPVNQ